MQTAAKPRTRILLTVREVAERWGVHPTSVKRWIRLHSLQEVRIGGRQMLRVAEMERAERKGLVTHE